MYAKSQRRRMWLVRALLFICGTWFAYSTQKYFLSHVGLHALGFGEFCIWILLVIGTVTSTVILLALTKD